LNTGENPVSFTTCNDLFAATTAAAGLYLAAAKQLAIFCPDFYLYRWSANKNARLHH
jgi:hypothetical protein